MPSDAERIHQIIYGNASLFSDKVAYFCESVLSKAPNRKLLKEAYADPHINLSIWEGALEQKDIKKYFPQAHIRAFQLPINLWKFLDALAPGHAPALIRNKNMVLQNVEEPMLLYMMQRRIKDLILVQKGVDGKRQLASWQKQNVYKQGLRWGTTLKSRLQNLHKMYNKLYDIEVGLKTGTLPYSVNQALDIVFSFYLQ